MCLFYLAYRYNVLYVAETQIDTCGLIYPQALKQLLSGIYLAEICLVGMFTVSKAVGPAILMAVFLVLTILCHISLFKALNPLLRGPPMCPPYEEEGASGSQQRKQEDGQVQSSASSASINTGESSMTSEHANYGSKNIFTEANFNFERLKSWFYIDFTCVDQLVHHEGHKGQYNPEEPEDHAYVPPSVTSQTFPLWIPADGTGISKQEVLNTSEVTPISNKGCRLNSRNKIEWDSERPQPPERHDQVSV
jgi:hypothetical protein